MSKDVSTVERTQDIEEEPCAAVSGWLASRDAAKWSAGWSEDFKRGYDAAVEEVRAALDSDRDG